jgi:preprotein translocase subunit SecD
VLQVETSAAVKSEIDLAINRIGQMLKEKGIPFTGVASAADGLGMDIQGTDPSRSAEVREIVDTIVPRWNVTPSGADWSIRIPDAIRQQVEATSVDTTLTVLRQRVDELGVKEPIIQKQGSSGDRIVVELPGLEDPERAKGVLQDQAVLEWKAVAYPQGVTDFETWRPPATKEAMIQMLGGSVPPNVELAPEIYVESNGTKTEFWWPLQSIAAIVGTICARRRGADSMQRNVVDFVPRGRQAVPGGHTGEPAQEDGDRPGKLQGQGRDLGSRHQRRDQRPRADLGRFDVNRRGSGAEAALRRDPHRGDDHR